MLQFLCNLYYLQVGFNDVPSVYRINTDSPPNQREPPCTSSSSSTNNNNNNISGSKLKLSPVSSPSPSPSSPRTSPSSLALSSSNNNKARTYTDAITGEPSKGFSNNKVKAVLKSGGSKSGHHESTSPNKSGSGLKSGPTPKDTGGPLSKLKRTSEFSKDSS